MPTNRFTIDKHSLVMEAKIGKISEISTLCDEKSRLCSILYRLYRRFDLGRILYDCGMEKCQGVPVKALLLCLLVIRFCGGSVRSASQCGYWGLLACRGKDSLYRLLNRSGMDWRRLLHACFLAFRKICLNESMHTPTHSSAPACLVSQACTFISFITVFTTFIYAVKVAKIIETNK